MDGHRFDTIARLFSARRARRAAQEATPEGTPLAVIPNDPHPSADAPARTEYLFVQTFAGGTWAPKAGTEGVFTLTLSGASASTVYFSDRPERIFGTVATQDLIDGLGFTPANPPNAALVARRTDGDDQEVLVVELLNPAYDAAAGTLTYDAVVLADYGEPGLADAARRQADYEFPESFAGGSVFIDDCQHGNGYCYQEVNGNRTIVGDLSLPRCNYFGDLPVCSSLCGNSKDPHYGELCHERFPDKCSFNSNGIQGWDCFADLYY